MAISIDWPNKLISVPQADLTFISGTLYELNTNTFRLALKGLEDDEAGMPWERTHKHNTEVTVAGITYARTVEIINGYSIEFENGFYSVRLAGSNNNIFDIENGILVQNNVQVIPTNSAGYQIITQGSGVTQQDKEDIAVEVWLDAPMIRQASQTMIIDEIDTGYVHTQTQFKGGGIAVLPTHNNAFIGKLICFTTGALRGEVRPIQAFNSSTEVWTVAPNFPIAPSDGDAYMVM